jgi:predicted TIM-barrel fold metal-dependent hydrolase
MNYRIISADDHIDLQWLPKDLWQKRVAPEWRKRAHGGLQLAIAPSAYFRRQVWATFQIDHVGLRLLDVIGDDRVMWASDYPHADSTWPDSQKAIAANFKDVADPARRRILCDNARALYGL